MGVLRNLLVGVVALSFVVFVALFGQLPALRKTPISWLQRALCVHVPNAAGAVDRRVTGGQIARKSTKLGNYLFHKQNPVILILFLAILSGSAGLFLWNTYHQLPTSLLLPVPILLGLPYLFTYLSAAHQAHYITLPNHDSRLHDYPYDHVLFRPNAICRTCHLTKPARSKHCSLCAVCVAVCDHHCPWVNNCLGRGNYRYFLALLLSLGVLEIYGAYLSYFLLRPYLCANAANSSFPKTHLADLGDRLVDAVNKGGLSIAGVGMLAASTAAFPLALLAYHCYLIWAGMTTNESQKWADWRDAMADGVVFKASRKALETHNKLRKYGERRDGLSLGNGELGHEQEVAWPISSDQVIVRTNDGRPPTGQEALWSRVWSLSEVENLYDLGGWDNFIEVLCGR